MNCTAAPFFGGRAMLPAASFAFLGFLHLCPLCRAVTASAARPCACSASAAAPEEKSLEALVFPSQLDFCTVASCSAKVMLDTSCVLRSLLLVALLCGGIGAADSQLVLLTAQMLVDAVRAHSSQALGQRTRGRAHQQRAGVPAQEAANDSGATLPVSPPARCCQPDGNCHVYGHEQTYHNQKVLGM